MGWNKKKLRIGGVKNLSQHLYCSKGGSKFWWLLWFPAQSNNTCAKVLLNCWPIFKNSLRCSAESSSFSFGHSDIAKRCPPSLFPGPHPRFLKQTKFLHIIFTRAAAIVLPSPKLMCTQYTIFGQRIVAQNKWVEIPFQGAFWFLNPKGFHA